MESDPQFVRDIDAKAQKGDAASEAASRCLQAMRSVICTNGVPSSATAYFAATVAALQRHLSQKNAFEAGNGLETTAALLFILRRALASVTPSVAHSRLNDVVASITNVFRSGVDEAVTRQAIVCLSVISDASYAAAGRPNRKVLKPIFACLTDTRTGVRHQAGLSVVAIIKKAAGAKDNQTMEFSAQHLASMIESARPDKKAEEIPAQRAVSLLRAIAPLLPEDQLNGILTAIARLPAALGQHPCSTAAFVFVAEHFSPKEDEEEDDDDQAMGEEANVESRIPSAAKLLPGLLSVPVTMLNVAYVTSYAKALSACTAVLCGSSASSTLGVSASEVLPQRTSAVQKLLALFAERDPSLLRGAREACLSLFVAAGKGSDVAFLQELLEELRPLLRFEAKASWPHALPVVAGLFEALGVVRAEMSPSDIPNWTNACAERARSLLSELLQARDKARSSELNVFGKELAAAIGAAISTFGPDQVLTIAPLEILQHPLNDTSYEQKSRSWLLLVLKDSIRRTSLSIFANSFLSLASALKARATEATKADSQVLSKRYLTLLEQVWALLPGFCEEALDLQAALLSSGGQLAKQMVAVLQNEPLLRDYVWVAFKRCCDAALEPPSPLSQTLKESNTNCLKTLSSRVMPEMFNAYLKMHVEMEGQDQSRISYSRQLALAALQNFAQLSEPAFVGSLFKSLVAKWLKATTELTGDAALAEVVPLGDLANALVPYLPSELLELLLKVFMPALKGATASEDDRSVAASAQKAAYRALCSAIRHPGASSGALGGPKQVIGLWNSLKDARQTCSPGALKARLASIQALLSLLESSLAPHFNDAAVKQEYMQCLTTILPEILFHLRDQSSAVRDAARECLHIAAGTAIHKDLQAEIVTILSAGLAGLSRQSKAAALDALSRLLYEHHSNMVPELRRRLMTVVLLLLEDRDAQVWRAALKFTKVVVCVSSKETLIDLLPSIMKLFDSRHLASAKMLVRSIIERLVKVMPEEVLQEVFPKAHLPLLQHVQKQVARWHRPKTVREVKATGEEDEANDDEDVMDANGRKTRKTAEKDSWEAFKASDEAEADLQRDGDDDMDGEGPVLRAKAGKRARADDDAAPASGANRKTREPPTSAVMAHDAVQALLDAWEAEEDSVDGEGRKGRAKSKRKRDAVAASTWIQEDQDVPIDFMSADAAHSVLTVRPPPSKRRRGGQVGNAGAENKADALRRNGLRFAEDGRLVVDDTIAQESEEKKSANFTLGANTKKVSPLSQLAAKRLARAKAKAQAKSERRGGHIIRGMESYKPGRKKAQGDAKRRGSKLEPFAYVRLNPKVTKEKFKDKATHSFSKVIKGAKKGILKGMKAKIKDQKMRQSKEVRKQKRARAQKIRRPGSR